MTARKRRNYEELANELHVISERPENGDRKWDWVDIGVALGISAPTAQRLVQWMRQHYTDQYWMVGISKTDYMTMPTRLARLALDGMLNQQLHIVTRLQTMQMGCATLARVDPTPEWQALMELYEEHCKTMLTVQRNFREVLVTRAERLGWAAA
jgi:hypothetical protein